MYLLYAVQTLVVENTHKEMQYLLDRGVLLYMLYNTVMIENRAVKDF